MILQFTKLYFKCLIVFLILYKSAMVQAANNYVVAPSGGDITGAALSQQLALNDVTILSSQGHQSGSGNIIINDVVVWSSNNSLTLVASNNILVNKVMIASGNSAGLTINPGTANGGEQPVSGAGYTLSNASIALSGTSPSLTISNEVYVVLNSVGESSDKSGQPAPPTLQGMAATNSLSQNYALGGDIDASATSTWNGDKGFTPIGTEGTPFSGKLDGLGHEIRGLSISLPTSDGVGLFGAIDTTSMIRNISLENAEITGKTGVGSLVGINGGSVLQTFANSTVTGNKSVGGLVGRNSGTIELSYTTGQVNISLDAAGSLVGENSSTGVIKNSYATGNVTGTSSQSRYIAGLVGNNAGGEIDRCFSTGVPTTDNPSVAVRGLVGTSPSATNTKFGYWDSTSSGVDREGTGGSPLTAQEMTDQASFIGFDFTNVWEMVAGEAHPKLRTNSLSNSNTSIIYTLNQLQAIENNLAGNYFLGADIDASATGSGAGGWSSKGFKPLGTSDNPFTGSLNGMGFTISNLTINRPTERYAGLFGYTSSTSSISKVGINNIIITGNEYVGALVGFSQGTINNSFANEVNITINGAAAGGLVGRNLGSINEAHTSGNITGLDRIGGLVGSNSGRITSSHSRVNLADATGAAGGLVGKNESGASIKSCHSSGSVTFSGGVSNTNTNVGGLVGLNSGGINFSNALGKISCVAESDCGGLVGENSSGTIVNAYSTGGVTGSAKNAGGLVGVNSGTASITTSYATGEVASTQPSANIGGLVGSNNASLQDTFWNSSLATTGVGKGESTGSTGLTAADMLIPSSFTNFQLTTTPGDDGWVVINPDGSLQKSKGNSSAGAAPMLASEYSTNITNAHQLQLMLMKLNGSYSLATDISAVNTASGNDVWGSSGFVPVSIGYTTVPFTGKFDGKNKTIRDLYINRTDSNVGLFGNATNASISNVKLVNATVVGNNSVGALVGGTQGGSITNTFASGYVSGAFTYSNGKGDNIGVLVGYNNAVITQSASTGIAYGGKYVGGIVGYNTNQVTNSYSSSNVNARGLSAGGLVGYNTGSINNTYATGDVISRGGLGGLVGTNSFTPPCYWWRCSAGKVSNSYARNRSVHSPSSENIGGLVGLNQKGSISNSYWDTTTSGLTTSAGGTGETDASMKEQSTFQSWDFSNIWEMSTYPKLKTIPSL